MSALLHREFTYDIAGRLASLQDSQWGELRYLYDSEERIIATTSEFGNEHFAYDPAGNLRSFATESEAEIGRAHV